MIIYFDIVSIKVLCLTFLPHGVLSIGKMERKRQAGKVEDLLRTRLFNDMLELYDATIDIYRICKSKPDLEEVLMDASCVGKVVFKNVPEKVMQKIFTKVEELKQDIACEYCLSYTIEQNKADNKYAFEIASKKLSGKS